METALARLKEGKEMPRSDSVDMGQFEEIVDIQRWKTIEERYPESRG